MPKLIPVCCLAVFSLLFCSFCAKADLKKPQLSVIVPLSGEMAFIGGGIKQGLLLNTDLRRRLAISFEDNKGSDQDSVTAFHKAVSVEKASIVVSAAAGSEALAALAESEKLPLLLTVSSSSGITKNRDYVFRFFTSADVDVPIIAAHIVRTRKLPKIGLLYLQDQFGEDYARVFKKSLKALGGRVTAEESFSYDDHDFRAQLLRLKKYSFDALYLVGLDYQIVGILKQAGLLGIKVPAFSVGTVAHKQAVSLGKDALEGLEVTAFCSDKPSVDFVKMFKARFGEAPTFYAELGYDIGEILSKVVDHSKKSLLEGFSSLADLELNTGRTAIAQNGELIIPTCVKRITNGKILNLATGKFSEY